MKLKINKACDLSSISVLPRQSRRLSSIGNGPQTSQMRPPTSQQSISQGMSTQHGMFSQASQLRSQSSQQSTSQGLSSQHGMYSQLSQNPLDDSLTNDLRFRSQEKENCVKKTSGLPLLCYACEDSQMVISRAPSSSMREKNEELEHRLGVIEISLNKYGIILDSVQSDVIQVNRGTKEVTMEMEGLRQKLVAVEASLHQLIKGQENNKVSFKESLESLSQQLSKDTDHDKLQQACSVLSAIPEQIQASLGQLHNELRMTFAKATQAITNHQRIPANKSPSIRVLPAKVHGSTPVTEYRKKGIFNGPEAVSDPKSKQPTGVPQKVETGDWRSVRVLRDTSNEEEVNKRKRRAAFSSFKQESELEVIIDSDEEIDGGFSCLINENDPGLNTNIIDESVKDTERIIRKARRRKRKVYKPSSYSEDSRGSPRLWSGLNNEIEERPISFARI